MASEMKSIRGIRTMGRLVDGRRVRTPAGALIELSAIANEKQLLKRELDRYARRHVEIEARLTEIAAKEARLMAMATDPNTMPVLPIRASSECRSAAAEIKPEIPSDHKFKIHEISY